MTHLNNQVHLLGNLGADPEVKSFENGRMTARFSLATNTKFKNNEGELVDDTQWHTIVAWGKSAELAEKYLKKGSKIALEGRLNNRQYETSEGEKKFITEIIVSEIVLLDKK